MYIEFVCNTVFEYPFQKDGEEPPAPPPLKPKYNPTFDSSRIGSHTQMPTGEAGKAEYKTEYNRSFSGDERYVIKFSFSEKATKIWTIHPLDLTFT